MAYVEWHGGIQFHHKTADLAGKFKVSVREAVGIRGSLYAWVIENRPSGRIERKLVAFACMEQERAADLISALIGSGLLDVVDEHWLAIHDWQDYTRGYRKSVNDLERWHNKNNPSAKLARVSREPSGEQTRTEQDGPEQTRAEYGKTNGADAPPEATASAVSVLDSILQLWNHGVADRHWIRSTPARLAKIKARLKDGFELVDLRKAVANIKQSEWHNGGNDRGWKAPGPEWVFHTRERTEQWVNWEKPKTQEEQLREWARGVDKQKGNGHA